MAAPPLDDDYVERLVDLDERLRQGQLVANGSSSDEALRKEDISLLRKLHRHWGGRAKSESSATTDLSASSASSLGGAMLGRFRIERELGRGGFGVVLRAFDPDRQRSVAVKVPRPEMLAHAQARQRFLREAQAAANFDHPHVLGVLKSARWATSAISFPSVVPPARWPTG